MIQLEIDSNETAILQRALREIINRGELDSTGRTTAENLLAYVAQESE